MEYMGFDDMITLTFEQPTLAHKETVQAYCQAYLVGYNHSIVTGGDGLGRFDEYQDWLDYVYAPAGKNVLGFDKVPCVTYLAMLDGVMVGVVNIRYDLTSNPLLLKVGGHVGYSTHPDYQGRGIASRLLKFAMQILADKGITPILVSCADNNIASIAVIEKCGGVLENIVNVPVGDKEKQVRRYWIR